MKKVRFCNPCQKNKYSQQTAISRALAQSMKTGVALRIYRCPYGSGYHLTSKVNVIKGTCRNA